MFRIMLLLVLASPLAAQERVVLATTTELAQRPSRRGLLTAWNEARDCYTRATGSVPGRSGIIPPRIVVLPDSIDQMRVIDSLIDPAEESASRPHIAYALLQFDLVVAARKYWQDERVIRHEYLHHILWREFGRKGIGHPEEFFPDCDAH